MALVSAGGLFVAALAALSTSGREARRVQATLAASAWEESRDRASRALEAAAADIEERLLRLESEGEPLDLVAGTGSPQALRALLDFVSDEAARRGLEVLDLVRTDGRVLASAHWPASSLSRVDRGAAPGRTGRTGPARIESPASDGSALGPDGRPIARLAWVHTRRVDRVPEPGLALVVGQFLDRPETLRAMAGNPAFVEIALSHGPAVGPPSDGASGATTTASAGADRTAAREIVLERTLPLLPSFDDGDIPGSARQVVLRLGRTDEARAARRSLFLSFVLIAVALLGGSLVAASVLARRLATPIAALADGARALAAGDLDHRVVVERDRKDELTALVDAFNAMATDLRESRGRLVRSERIAAWREIAQRIAHEIKNPLTPIQLAVETTRRAHREKHAAFDEIFEESAQAILEEVDSLKRLVREFSEFARMPEPRLEPADLNDVVRSALRLFSGLPAGVALRTELADGLPPIDVDREQMSRAVLNLVANAADAVGERGSIVVRTGRTNDGVELTVDDDGPGIPDDARERLFTPYFTTKAHGTGLGLAIVHRIVAEHGAEIGVESRPGEGACFAIRIPSPPKPRI